MRIKQVNQNIMILEFFQEKNDKDYGSCLWARFMFNLDKYELMISSDCGVYGYKWVETTKSESFMELMSRIDDGYLLSKIYGSEDIFDYNATRTRIYEYWGEDEDDREKLNEIFDGMEVYGEEPDNASEFMRVFEDNNHNDFCDIWELCQFRYPSDALKIVEIFKNHIQPYIKLLMGGEKL